MSAHRITLLTLGLICSALLLSVPVCAQDIRQDVKEDAPPPNCTVIRYEPEKHTLPIATSDEEYKAYTEIAALQSPQDLLVQGQAFLEKHPQSDLRFPIYQNLVTAAIRLNNFDLAFELGKKALGEFPDHVLVMTQLATIASNQMLTGNLQFADEGRSYACKALSFILEEKMPYGYTLERWKAYRNSLLGDVYQALGIFALLNDCPEDAINALTRASELHPSEPYTYFLLAKAQVRLYQWGTRKAMNFKDSAASTEKQPATLPTTLLEQIAKTYAYATVLTESEQYKALRAAVDYDMQMLGKILGRSVKVEFARSIEAARNELNANMAKPPVVATTERP